MWVLLCRSARTTLLGQTTFLAIRLALHVVVALTLTALYSREIGTEDSCYTTDPRFDARNCSCTQKEEELRQESVAAQNVKFQFFSLLFLMFAALMPTVLTYPAEIKVFLNEHRNGWYTPATYYIAKTVVEIPAQLLYPAMYVWFLYWYTQQVGMDSWYGGVLGLMTWRYGIFLAVSIAAGFIAQGVGFLIGILCVNSSNISIILSSSVLLFLFLFSGFFVKVADMGPHVAWITNLSFIRFAFEGLLVLIYGYDRCGLIPPPGPGTLPTVPTKSSILYIFSLTDSDLQRSAISLAAHFLVIRILAFVALKNLANPKFLRPKALVGQGVGCLLQSCSICSVSDSSRSCCWRVVGIVIRIWLAIFALQIVGGLIAAFINALNKPLPL